MTNITAHQTLTHTFNGKIAISYSFTRCVCTINFHHCAVSLHTMSQFTFHLLFCSLLDGCFWLSEYFLAFSCVHVWCQTKHSSEIRIPAIYIFPYCCVRGIYFSRSVKHPELQFHKRNSRKRHWKSVCFSVFAHIFHS